MFRTIVLTSLASLLLTAGLQAHTRDTRLVKEVEAQCTAEARQNGVRGVVSLLIEIDNEGTPAKVEPVAGWWRGTFHPTLGYGLEEAAIEAVSQWRFKPSGTEARVGTMYIDVGFRCTKPLKTRWPRPD